MSKLLLLLVLAVASAAWAKDPVVSFPLAVQIDAAGSKGQGGNLAKLVDPANTAGVAIGEWIEFGFSKPVAVTKVTVVNGWAAPGSFKQHGRIKTAELVFDGGGKQTITLKDTDKPQVIALHGNGSAVRLTVTSVYHGTAGNEPYLSRISFDGYDPSETQVTVTGRYEGCVRSRSSSSWEGQDDPFYYCARFRADDGSLYGCIDDLCFHSKEHVNVRLKVTGFIKEGNVLQVLEATPVK